MTEENDKEKGAIQDAFTRLRPRDILMRPLFDEVDLIRFRPWMHVLTSLFLVSSAAGYLFFWHGGVLLIPEGNAFLWLLATVFSLLLVRRTKDIHAEYLWSMTLCSLSILGWMALVADPVSTLLVFCNLIFITFVSITVTPVSGFVMLLATFAGVALIRGAQLILGSDFGLAGGTVAWMNGGYLVMIFVTHFASVCFVVALVWSQKERNRLSRLEVEKANEQLRESERARSVFLSTVTHELRTPLTSIYGYVDLMLGQRKAFERELGIVKNATTRLRLLTDEILNLADPPSLARRLNLETFDLSVVLREECAMFRERAIGSGITLRVGETESCCVRADRVRIGQVISNLIANAIDHTDTGKHITVGLRNEGDCAVLSVEDEGCGIAPGDLNLIFKPFFTQKSETGVGKGTGLGLSITKQIVEATGGDISVTSQLGLGSRFTVSLPISSIQSARCSEFSTDGFRALVLDDEPDIRALMEAQLESLGFAVETCANGKEALERLADAVYDLIILDVNVPKVSGVEVSRRHVETNGSGRVFLFSAIPPGEVGATVREARAHGFISKPWTLDQLERILRDSGLSGLDPAYTSA